MIYNHVADEVLLNKLENKYCGLTFLAELNIACKVNSIESLLQGALFRHLFLMGF
jgi:hypothetical protein